MKKLVINAATGQSEEVDLSEAEMLEVEMERAAAREEEALRQAEEGASA